ncbi:MAG: hypothetical protein Q8K38_02195 [Burkholderiaceae bacterium]|nr:hypothetical protein [Burkholderiaceae bacterium]MDZ4144519.1 hypothetical protein [Burkholderiales bacterium]
MDQDLRALRQQLVQLKALHDSGALSAAQFDESRTRLEKRIVELVMDGAADPAAGTAPGLRSTDGDSARPSPRLLALLTTVVLVVAVAGYAWTGMHAQVGSGAGEASASADASAGINPQVEQIAAMVDKLAAHLKEQPDDADGWAMLGRSYTVLGRHAEALTAYENAVKLRSDDAQLLADYADSLAVKNDRQLAGEPIRMIEKALKLNPRNVKALALAGTYAFTQQDYATAVRHWERVVQFAPAESGYVQQIQAALAEARQLAGLPPEPSKQAAAAPSAAAPTAPSVPSAPAAGQSVRGTVVLAPSLAKLAGPDDTVFIFARAANGGRMPLAILRKQVRDLPVQFTLDDSLSMSPAAKLSGAPLVVVSARISKSGEALPKPGDLAGQAAPVALGATGVRIEISDQVK